jgi:hypothetical protein
MGTAAGDPEGPRAARSTPTATVRLLAEADDALWEDGLAHSTQSSFLQWLPMLRAIGRRLGGLEVIGVERAGQLIGGVAGLVDASAGVRDFQTNVLTAYHGLWVRDAGLRPARTEALVTTVARVLVPFLDRRYRSWTFLSAPELVDARPFRDLGCRVDAYFTDRLALERPERLLAQMEKEARRWIRRAEQGGTRIDACAPTEENLGAFEAHLRTMYRRRGLGGRKGFPEGLFPELGRLVAQAGRGQLFLARTADGVPVASTLCTWDEHRAYAFVGSSDVGLARGGELRLMDWRMFAWLWERGHREIDLLGGNRPPLRAFKKAYNGRVVPYPRISRNQASRVDRMGHLRAAMGHLLRALGLRR